MNFEKRIRIISCNCMNSYKSAVGDNTLTPSRRFDHFSEKTKAGKWLVENRSRQVFCELIVDGGSVCGVVRSCYRWCCCFLLELNRWYRWNWDCSGSGLVCTWKLGVVDRCCWLFSRVLLLIVNGQKGSQKLGRVTDWGFGLVIWGWNYWACSIWF